MFVLIGRKSVYAPDEITDWNAVFAKEEDAIEEKDKRNSQSWSIIWNVKEFNVRP